MRWIRLLQPSHHLHALIDTHRVLLCLVRWAQESVHRRALVLHLVLVDSESLDVRPEEVGEIEIVFTSLTHFSNCEFELIPIILYEFILI